MQGVCTFHLNSTDELLGQCAGFMGVEKKTNPYIMQGSHLLHPYSYLLCKCSPQPVTTSGMPLKKFKNIFTLRGYCAIYNLDVSCGPSMYPVQIFPLFACWQPISTRKGRCDVGNNDCRPAMTSVVMKCFEKLVLEHLKSFFPKNFDLYLFAFRSKANYQ